MRFYSCCLRIALVLLTIALAIVAQTTQAERLYLATDIYSPAQHNGGGGYPGQADELYQRARKQCETGDVGAALRLATEAVAVEPDHADARRVLGYRRTGGHWAGSYAARRLERDEIWHPQFGWIKATDLGRYEAGERPFGKRWISAEEDSRRHTTIDGGWKIRTDHFQVVTNHSREEAARLATQLEQQYQIWQQLFGGFYLKPVDLLKRFDGKTSSGYRSKPFQVNYYRTRDQYNKALITQQPRIAMTLGIYFDTTRKTHFFAGKDQDAGTIYHEAVHQFFHESGRAARNVGANSNAWLIEGVACYFESLTPGTDKLGLRSYTIGMPGMGRLPAARHRRLVNDYYVPLAELSALGITDFQRRDDLPRLYSQSAGLVTFLMHAEQGRYRPALVKLLQLLYTGRDQPTTLEELTGQSFAELDRQYRRYLEQMPSSAEAAP